MIRKLDKNDLNQLQNLFKQLYKILFVNRPDVFYDRQPITANYFQDLLSSNTLSCYVYEEDEKIIGAIVFEQKNSNDYVTLKNRTIYQINDVLIDYEYRFKHIGESLSEFIENLATQNNIDAIEAKPWIFDFEAIKFYETVGMGVKKVTYEKILNENYYEKTKQVELRAIEKVVK